jgi:hypothetical protein
MTLVIHVHLVILICLLHFLSLKDFSDVADNCLFLYFSLRWRVLRASPPPPPPPVVWTSLGPLPRWVPGPTTRWAPGTTRLALHGT